MKPDSPCIGVCQLAENELVCIGCRRTLSEISRWPRLTDDEKIQVLTAIAGRQPSDLSKTKPPPAS